MAETTTASPTPASGGSGRSMNPDLRKTLWIIGGIFAVLLLCVAIAMMMRSGSKGSSTEGSRTVLPGVAGAGMEKDTQPTARQQEMLRAEQMRLAREAAAKGEMYVPTDSTPAQPLPAAPAASAPMQPQPVMAQGGELPSGAAGAGQPYPAAAAPVVSEEEQQRLARQRRGMEQVLQQLAIVGKPTGDPIRVSMGSTNGTGAGTNAPGSMPGAQGGQSGNGGSAAAGAAAQGAGGETLADSYEIYAGATASPIDTYKTGYVSARIVAGKLKGAFLVGRTEMVNEGLQPRFTGMRFNGRSYKITAIALDEQTSTDAVNANLDRRYLQRYVMPVLMAGINAVAGARAQTGSQVVVSVGGQTVSVPPPTREQATNAGIAAATAMAGRAIDREAQLPIQATLPADTGIGIMFLEPVVQLDSDPALFRGTTGAGPVGGNPYGVQGPAQRAPNGYGQPMAPTIPGGAPGYPYGATEGPQATYNQYVPSPQVYPGGYPAQVSPPGQGVGSGQGAVR